MGMAPTLAGLATAATGADATAGALGVGAKEPVAGRRRTSWPTVVSEVGRDRVGMQGRPGVPAPLRRATCRGEGGGGVPAICLGGPATGV